jgi:VanZ like family.
MKGVLVMRFIPLLIILTISIISGLIINHNIKEFEKRHFYLISLSLFNFSRDDSLYTNFVRWNIGLCDVGGNWRVNLHQLDIIDIGFAENIILTVPLGFLIKKLFPHVSILSMAFTGFMIGGGIETLSITYHIYS